ncbi:MAG: AAA family ATPase [Candidatus Shikimatogenerans sp. AspAUS03]|uniref:AAA family ATPase n=1 Tax=Candidatus Shikimatogenerans sp. AspAUS03 TaxID=3158563 RepID=A0AAU7QT74_9FLAO
MISLNIKYRPKKFKNIIDQNNTIKILKNMLKNNILNNTILLHGPYGTGKTSCARIIAKYLNKNIKDKNIIKNNIIEINASINNSIEDVKNINKNILIENIGKKIFIIDEIHMFSNSAFNGFLKILEEPPFNVYFILITTKYDKIPSNIISRCNSFYFKKINTKKICKYIKCICNKERIYISKKSLEIISKYSKGSLRNALIIINKFKTYKKKIKSNLIIKILNIIPIYKIKKLFKYIQKIKIQKTLNYFNKIIKYCRSYKKFIFYIYKYIRKNINIINIILFEFLINLIFTTIKIITTNNNKNTIELFLLKIIFFLKKYNHFKIIP